MCTVAPPPRSSCPWLDPLSGFLKHGQLWPRDQPLRFWQLHEADPWKQQAVVSIDEKLYAAAKSFSTQKYQDTAAQLRFTFFFAVNLLHEVSHCFESKCGHSQYYDLISKDRAQPAVSSRAYFTHHLEPEYKDYEVEMGAAFEHETFGGRVHPINHDFSASSESTSTSEEARQLFGYGPAQSGGWQPVWLCHSNGLHRRAPLTILLGRWSSFERCSHSHDWAEDLL